MQRLVREIATTLRNRLAEDLGESLLEVRVFGSRARDDAECDSDLDLFVLVAGDEVRHLRTVVARANELAIEMELPFDVSPLVMSREHFAHLQARDLRLARDLLTEGVVV